MKLLTDGVLRFVRLLAFMLCCTAAGACAADTSTNGEAGGPSHTVGVYYYPWYAGDFHGRRYLRQRLTPPQPPSLGEYDDRDAGVISQHLQWSREANVSLWVASWWGPGRREDVALRQHILPHNELGDTRIALFYETAGRVPEFTDLTNVAADVGYMAANYFDHDNYLRIDGRPVLFVYLTRVLSRHGLLQEFTALARQTAAEAGHDIYLIGDEVFGKPPVTSAALQLLDGVTNYDVYGSMGAHGHAGQEAVDAYYAEQALWRDQATAVGVTFVPAATPGFNDKGVRQGHAAVSRQLSPDAEYGTLFRAMVQQAVNLTQEATGHLLLVTSWNEWHEDTQIEPVIVAAPTDVDDSGKAAFTEGLGYEGYGDRYLNILRQETTR